MTRQASSIQMLLAACVIVAGAFALFLVTEGMGLILIIAGFVWAFVARALQ